MGTKVGLTGITFGDATVQNTAPVTSAVAGSGISVSGATGAVTFTNSGVTSIVAGSGISISGGTGAVTVTASGGGTVTSVSGTNGLTGTVTTSGSLSVDTTFGNVGTYAVLAKFSSGQVFPGSTASGSGLGYWSSGTGNNFFFESNARRSGNTLGTPGAAALGYNSTTAVSGTWRSMSGTNGGGYDGGDNITAASQGLWIRTA
jgi:hypothetical protein